MEIVDYFSREMPAFIVEPKAHRPGNAQAKEPREISKTLESGAASYFAPTEGRNSPPNPAARRGISRYPVQKGRADGYFSFTRDRVLVPERPLSISAVSETPPAKVPLDALHRRLGARMVPFAGYDMPLHYGAGIVAEHLHTREKAGLFDVSHMGQAILAGAGAARLLEALAPADLIELAPERTRYTQLLDYSGGILDDLMATRCRDATNACSSSSTPPPSARTSR